MRKRFPLLHITVLLLVCFTTTSVFASGKSIIGSTKAEVDTLLSGWSSHISNRATATRPLYYYTKDIELIVTFTGEKAVGVAVVDRPGAGLSPISEPRFKELIAIIGGGEPKASDITRDGSGIREFSVGDAD